MLNIITLSMQLYQIISFVALRKRIRGSSSPLNLPLLSLLILFFESFVNLKLVVWILNLIEKSRRTIKNARAFNEKSRRLYEKARVTFWTVFMTFWTVSVTFWTVPVTFPYTSRDFSYTALDFSFTDRTFLFEHFHELTYSYLFKKAQITI